MVKKAQKRADRKVFEQEFVKDHKYEQQNPAIASAFALYGEKFVFGAPKVRI